MYGGGWAGGKGKREGDENKEGMGTAHMQSLLGPWTFEFESERDYEPLTFPDRGVIIMISLSLSFF